jgi:hypothetical protein
MLTDADGCWQVGDSGEVSVLDADGKEVGIREAAVFVLSY